MPNIIDVLLEANPSSLGVMKMRIQALADRENPKSPNANRFTRLKQIAHLHFMSIQIFEDAHFDPLLVFENNFDGDPDTYWTAVLGQLSDELRGVFSCTKEAHTPRWAPLFKAGCADSLLDFIKAHSFAPSAFHFGAVAYSLERIGRDRGVFNDIQLELGTAASDYHTLDAPGVQRSLRNWALQKYKWMHQAESPTTDQAIRTYKWSPLRPLLPWLIIALFIVGWPLFLLVRHQLHQTGFLPWKGVSDVGPIFLFFAFFLGVLLAILLPLFALGFALLKSLRELEGTDFTQANPNLSPQQLKLFAAQEDQIVQNHLASMVLVKSGILRGFLIRAALRLLKFGVPIFASNGYLGSMRTIHFAHWSLVGNCGRLLFLSNFDGSWQSYLDDFVDKASRGLTLAWGNCVGFPRTQDLILQGAAHGTQFKAWARQSQTQNILWYSAYSDLTVNQIIRNASIVDGLRKISMQQKEAEQWTQLL